MNFARRNYMHEKGTFFFLLLQNSIEIGGYVAISAAEMVRVNQSRLSEMVVFMTRFCISG